MRSGCVLTLKKILGLAGLSTYTVNPICTWLFVLIARGGRKHSSARVCLSGLENKRESREQGVGGFGVVSQKSGLLVLGCKQTSVVLKLRGFFPCGA